MIRKLRNLAKNRKGSEVVEKILMVVVSLAIGAAAVTFIWGAVTKASTASSTSTPGNLTGTPAISQQ